MSRTFVVVFSLAAASASAFAQPTDRHVEPVPLEPVEPVPLAPAPAPAVIPAPAPVPPPPAKEASVVQVTGAPGKGVTVKLGDAFSFNLRLRAQLRYVIHAPPPEAGDRALEETSQVGTLRMWLSGTTLVPKLTYMIQLALADRDYRDGAISPIFDAFVDYKAHRDLSLRAGQFFVPFDRLRTVREFALQLAERPRPVAELTLDRDVGVIAYSDNFLGARSPVAYRVGVFGGNGTNYSVPVEPGGMLVGRLEIRPLGPIDDDSEGDHQRRARPGLALGAGGAINVNTPRARSTSGATLEGGTVDYYHAALDATLKWRGVAVQLEYLWRGASTWKLESMVDGLAVTEYARKGQGWVAQASYTFDPPFELVGRVSRLYTPANTDPRLAAEVDRLGQEYAFGANYYFNDHQFKVQADWIGRTGTDGTSPKVDHLFHLQLDATF